MQARGLRYGGNLRHRVLLSIRAFESGSCDVTNLVGDASCVGSSVQLALFEKTKPWSEGFQGMPLCLCSSRIAAASLSSRRSCRRRSARGLGTQGWGLGKTGRLRGMGCGGVSRRYLLIPGPARFRWRSRVGIHRRICGSGIRRRLGPRRRGRRCATSVHGGVRFATNAVCRSRYEGRSGVENWRD
jgi:hypothetical protein